MSFSAQASSQIWRLCLVYGAAPPAGFEPLTNASLQSRAAVFATVCSSCLPKRVSDLRLRLRHRVLQARGAIYV